MIVPPLSTSAADPPCAGPPSPAWRCAPLKSSVAPPPSPSAESVMVCAWKRAALVSTNTLPPTPRPPASGMQAMSKQTGASEKSAVPPTPVTVIDRVFAARPGPNSGSKPPLAVIRTDPPRPMPLTAPGIVPCASVLEPPKPSAERSIWSAPTKPRLRLSAIDPAVPLPPLSELAPLASANSSNRAPPLMIDRSVRLTVIDPP